MQIPNAKSESTKNVEISKLVLCICRTILQKWNISPRNQLLTFLFTDARAEICAANQRFGEIMKTKDTQSLTEFYARDCKIMPPGGTVICGRDGKYIFLLNVWCSTACSFCSDIPVPQRQFRRQFDVKSMLKNTFATHLTQH